MQFQEQIFWITLFNVRIWNSGYLREKVVFLHLRISKAYLVILQANKDFEHVHRNLKHPIKIKTLCELKFVLLYLRRQTSVPFLADP